MAFGRVSRTSQSEDKIERPDRALSPGGWAVADRPWKTRRVTAQERLLSREELEEEPAYCAPSFFVVTAGAFDKLRSNAGSNGERVRTWNRS